MLTSKDNSNSSKNKDTKRANFFSLFYVSLFGFIFLSGSMLSIIPSSFHAQPVSMGLQDVYAQQYYPPPQMMAYDDKSYGGAGGDGGGANYYSNSYDNNKYDSYDSYDKKEKNLAEIEKDDNKLFICDNGIVVDDRINCPQKCPFNTPLEGVYVTDLDVCNTQPGVGITCPLDTDLPGVVVTDEANCNIFEVCDASSTPLGVALGQDVKVTDSALCQLSNVPNLQICDDGPFEGFAVNDKDACDTLDNVQICSLTSDLPGVLTTDPATCNIFETCDLNTPLGASLGTNVEVVDADICQLQFAVCDSDSGLARALGLTGPIVVADEQLCELEVISGTTTCPAGSDLEGVVVTEGQANVVCNLDIPDVATCDSDSGLARALGLTSTIQVADEQLCELEVTTGTTTCPAGSDLEGVVVLEGQANVICNLNIPELFPCPASSDIAGAQVTDLLICNLDDIELIKCLSGTNNEGAVVTDQILCQAPNDQNKCPAGTDLENVYVMNPDAEGACDIFEQCDVGDPIFSALPPEASEFKVVDDQICQLAVPEAVHLDQCPPGSNLGEGSLVTDPELCNAAVPAEQCPDDTTLEGVWVVEGGTAVCDLAIPKVEVCPINTNNEGALVTNLILCEAPNNANKCPIGSDLENVYVMDPTADGACDIFEQCDVGDPIFSALPPEASEFEVVDDQICQLKVPKEVQLFPCAAGSNLGEGALVTDPELCNAATPAEQCGTGTDLEGVWVVEATDANCNVELTVECPEGTLLAGATVTDLDLCNLVDVENKECQICATLVDSVLATSAANIVFNAINAYDPSPPDGETGLEAICTSANPITAYNAFVDQIPYPPADPGLPLFLKKQFATCEDVPDTCGAVAVNPNISPGFNSPAGVAYDTEHQRMYVANQGANTVSVINTNTNTVIDTDPIAAGINPITVESGPFGLAYDAQKDRMYVANFGGQAGNTVSVINTNTFALIDGNPILAGINPIPVATAPLNIAVDEEVGSDRIFVTSYTTNVVSIVDTNTFAVTPINLPAGFTNSWGVAYDPVHDTMYVTNFNEDSVFVIQSDTGTLIDTDPIAAGINPITVGDGPTDITYDPIHERMYVTDFTGGTVSVIDTETNTLVGSPIPIGAGTLPVYVAFDPINHAMYVTHQGGSSVSVIETYTNMVIGTIAVYKVRQLV